MKELLLDNISNNFVVDKNENFFINNFDGEKDIEMLAKRVKEGFFGDGKERVHKLAQLYDPVQKKVKELNKEMTKLKMKLE